METQDVAIKMVNVDREKNPDLYALVVQRFEREAKVLELLSGVPYMMRLVDHGSDSLLVCSLVEGESLMNFSREKMMVKDQAQLALKIVDALMGAHQRGIVHGDVNSTNLMVADNSPVFIDFNLAQNYPPTAQGFGGKFSRKAFEGAPGYLAPEMFLGKSVGQSVDLTWENAVQVDVYGLGAVLYHLFTGYIPYMGLDFVRDLLSQEAFQEAVNEEDRRRKLFKHVAELMNAWGTVTNPADVNYELPIEIGNIILELLNKNPSNRPSLLQVKKVLSHWVKTSDSFEAVA
ncbi:MAG: protein kinase [Deltaproteobacteria bacterium]|nr:MAG: protein kinase [Deltaproteobacteria bacterium]